MIMAETQRKKAFFTKDPIAEPHLPLPPTDEEIWAYLKSPQCPLSKIVVRPGSTLEGGNEGNMQILMDYAFKAMKNKDRSCRGLSMIVKAGSGQGKSFIMRTFGATIGIPFVFINSPAIESTHWLFEEICKQCEKDGCPIVKDPRRGCEYTLPPIIVALDEAHQIPARLQKGPLLNPMEMADGIMTCNTPGSKSDAFKVNCKNVCWVAMTTEGTLFDAFESRLETTIDWQSAGEEDLVKIIQNRAEQDYIERTVPKLIPAEAARLVARYCKIPREACAFARRVVWRQDAGNTSWEEAVETVRANSGLDEHGMPLKALNALTALGKRSASKATLASIVGVRVEEIERRVLPYLMNFPTGSLAIMMPGRGPTITKAGIEQLDRRGIEHNGDSVTVEHIEEHRSKRGA